MVRWEIVNFGPRIGKLMVHHFPPGVSDLHPHDHPSAFWTLVLKGSYDDLVPDDPWNGERLVVGDHMKAGMFRRRPARHMHITRIGPEGAWTLCWMGPKERPWGFLTNRAWYPWQEYVRAFGFGERC